MRRYLHVLGSEAKAPGSNVVHESPLDVVPSGELAAPLDVHPNGATEAPNELLVGSAFSSHILRQPDKLPALAGGQKADPRFLLHVLKFQPGGRFFEDAKLPPHPDSEHVVYVLDGIEAEGGSGEWEWRLRHEHGVVSGYYGAASLHTANESLDRSPLPGFERSASNACRALVKGGENH